MTNRPGGHRPAQAAQTSSASGAKRGMGSRVRRWAHPEWSEASSFRAQRVEADVRGDPVEPPSERAGGIEGVQPPPRADEGVLYSVFGVRPGPEHPVAVAKERPIVRCDDCAGTRLRHHAMPELRAQLQGRPGRLSPQYRYRSAGEQFTPWVWRHRRSGRNGSAEEARIARLGHRSQVERSCRHWRQPHPATRQHLRRRRRR